jgi:hypothetical protein
MRIFIFINHRAVAVLDGTIFRIRILRSDKYRRCGPPQTFTAKLNNKNYILDSDRKPICKFIHTDVILE